MTENTARAERPLVTFALFAYNQEKYIREAVGGAFSQTYSPLEIILSDDRSTDRTFEIIEEMAAAYTGPHKVVARQSAKNMGTLAHILEASQESHGEYIVVAAGDDISKPDRSVRTIEEMVRRKLDIISTASCEFQEDPRNITRHRRPVTKISDHLMKGRPKVEQIHGATAAYRAEFIQGIKYPETKVLLEDYVFRVVAHWQGMQVGTLDENLVLHRIHDSNVGPKSQKKDQTVIDREKALRAHYIRLIDVLEFLINIQEDLVRQGQHSRAHENPIDPVAIAYTRLRASWPDHSLRDRINFIKMSRSFDNPRRDAMRALGPTFYNFFAIAHEFIFRQRYK